MNRILALAAVLTMTAAAQANIQQPLIVRAEKAEAIIKALADAGVHHQQGQETSEWNASDVRVEYSQGFIWSQGSLTDAVTHELLNPIMGVSHAIYAALAEAGVPEVDLSHGGIKASEVRAKTVSCIRAYHAGAHTMISQCNIEL